MSVSADVKDMFTELVEYRELFMTMVRRDVMVRYKKTLIGVGWAIFTPVMNMIVFTIIFNKVAKIETPWPYPIFSYCGLLPWTMFSSSLKAGVQSLVTNKSLITKVYFPRELFPFGAVVVAIVDFLIGSTVLAALMIYYHVEPAATIWFLPVLVLIQTLFTAGVALTISMANLWYRDVKYLFDVVIQLWMFATPVVYPVRNVGPTLHFILQLNPMTPIIDGYRSVILRGEMPPMLPLLVATITSTVLFMLAWLLFHRAEYKFAENV